jgi:hypothetical protein
MFFFGCRVGGWGKMENCQQQDFFFVICFCAIGEKERCKQKQSA